MTDKKVRKKLKKTLLKKGYSKISLTVKDRIVYLKGDVSSYDDWIKIGKLAGKNKQILGVVNNIRFPGVKTKTKKTGDKKQLGETDVLIIGGGVTGCMIARELSKYKIKTTLVEKDDDVGCGATKANNAMVHSGIGEKPGSLKQILCVKGHYLFEKLAEELNVPYQKCGMFIILTSDSFSNYKIPKLIGIIIARTIIPFILKKRGKKIGIPIDIISKKNFSKQEPSLTDKAISVISSPTYGVTSPYEFAIALAENAVDNGVNIFLNTEIVDITAENKEIKSVVTTKGIFETKLVINAAGVFADEIADLANTRNYTIHPRKGSTLLFDKNNGEVITHNLSHLSFPIKEYTKGGGILVTAHGNIQWGPTALEIPEKDDKSVTYEEINQIFDSYRILLPNFNEKSIITYFAGIRAPTFTEDFFIQSSKIVKGFIDVAGIQSPGLAASPAIARMVVDIIKKEGFILEKKENFNPTRKKPVRVNNLNYKDRKDIIRKKPVYGRIICRCEGISEGEIVDAIHANPPALTMDAIKRRTRVGMGRCQSGFCLPKVATILSRETSKPIEEIMKNIDGSHLFIGKAKCLFKDEKDGS